MTTEPTLPADTLRDIADRFGTPCYVYDAEAIRTQIRTLSAFDTVRYAQKANANVHVLRLMRQEGVVVDAVSLGEIERALGAGYTGSGDPAEIVYTADLIDEATIDRVVDLGIPVNAGSEDMLDQIGGRRSGHPVWCRINPGFGHGHAQKANTGGPASKHGIWFEQMPAALETIRRHRLDLVGLHMHIGSGIDLQHLRRVADAMVEQVTRLETDIRAISGGGGLAIPYRPGDIPSDAVAYFEIWHRARERIEELLGHPVRLEIEPGRYLVGAAGVLLSRVRAVKRTGETRFVLGDAGFHNLLRPALYGAYHHISVLGPSGTARTGATEPTAVGGPLCESGDLFTQAEGGHLDLRPLPETAVGDLLVLHDAGAYAASMGSNYNGHGHAPEVLVDGSSVRLIRRRQSIDDLIALEDTASTS